MSADTDKAAVVLAVPSDAIAKELKAVRRAYDEQSFQAWLKAGKPQSTPEEIKKNKRNDDHFDACIDQLIQAVQTYVADTVACDAQEAFESWLQRVNRGFDSIDFVRIDGRYAQSHVEGMFHNFQAGFAAALSQAAQQQQQQAATAIAGRKELARDLRKQIRDETGWLTADFLDGVPFQESAQRLLRLVDRIPDLVDEATPTPPAATPAAPGEGVTGFNVGRWCLSEDDCIAGGIDFSAYERGVSDAATAFSRNASKAATAHPLCPRCGETTEPTNNAFDVAARLVRELQDETAARDKEAWMREASATLQRLARPAPVAAPAPASEAVAWLIEDQDHFPRHRWLRIVDAGKTAYLQWETDANTATHFARREDAVCFQKLHVDFCALSIVTGHSFIATPTPGDSVDAPVQQAALQEAARETIKWLNSYFRFHDGNKYADKLSAALKGEQPEPSGSERGNAA